MQQTPAGADGAVLVSIDFGENDYSESLEELRLLAETAGVRTLAIVEGKRQRPDAALFAGSGKVQEIAELVERIDSVPMRRCSRAAAKCRKSPNSSNAWKFRWSFSIMTFPPRKCAI